MKDKLVKFIYERIAQLNKSLKENSIEMCDDDEMPDYDQRMKDHAQISAFGEVLKFINQNENN